MMRTSDTNGRPEARAGAAPDAESGLPLEPWGSAPAILLVDLDAFFASVEQLDHPAWRGKPVIVGGDADKRGVVSTCSYEARAFGVRSAMPASTAARLCPDAIWTNGSFHRYREVSRAIMSIIGDETPHVQQVSIDEAFADVTPNELNTEHPVRIAARIQRRVSELGVTCSIGVGTTKSIAKVASDMDKPRGLTVVYPGGEAAFLAPLPVRAMSGVGPAAEKALKGAGIQTLGQMAEASDGLLRSVFGKNADMMRARACGGDVSEVQPDDAVKSVSHEVSFAEDLVEQRDVDAALATLADQVGRRLRMKGLKGRTLSCKVRYDDRSVRSAQMQLPEPSDDELYLTPFLHQLVEGLWRPGIKVRLLGVAVSGFAHAASPAQDALFALDDNLPAGISGTSPRIADERKRQGLLAATDACKDRFGEDAVRFGHELRNESNTTGSSTKIPADYK